MSQPVGALQLPLEIPRPTLAPGPGAPAPGAPALAAGEVTVAGEIASLRQYPTVAGGMWSVGTVVLPDGATARIVGHDLPGDLTGAHARLTGAWVVHPLHGLQLEVARVAYVLPHEREATIRYLVANVATCGPVRAAALYDALGPRCLDVLTADPDAARQVCRGARSADRIAAAVQAWRDRRADTSATRRLVVHLMAHGASLGTARRVCRYFGRAAAAEIVSRKDPYRLAEVPGLGFRTADRLARALGVDRADPARTEAGLRYALERAMAAGHTALPPDALTAAAADVLDAAPGDITPAVARGVADGIFAEDGGLVYLPEALAVEAQLGARCTTLLHATPEPPPPEAWPQIDAAAAAAGLSGEQAAAVRMALTEGLSVLTGLPGAGKTRTLRTVLHCCAQVLGWSVRLAAPTGKAASRAFEMTGVPASTIHRLLGTAPGLRRESALTPRLLVCDEWSMVGLEDAAWLADNCDPRTTALLLVGDPAQLPSIGHGSVLRDLLASSAVPRAMLTGSYRMDRVGRMARIARALLAGDPLDLAADDDASDLHYVDVSRSGGGPAQHAAALAALDRTVGRLVADRDAVAARDVQVLAPMRKGALGVDALNERLQRALNPRGIPGPTIGGRARVRVGDRVIQTVNDYDVPGGLMNGEQGIVRAVGRGAVTLAVPTGDGDERDVSLSGLQLLNLRLGWAITVHRAQGSEYPYTIVLYEDAHDFMLSVPLLYTAMTRASRQLTLVSTRTAIGRTLERRGINPRHTGLARRLIAPRPARS